MRLEKSRRAFRADTQETDCTRRETMVSPTASQRLATDGSPEGIRTLVAGLRSQSPRPLDDGALVGKAIQFFRWGTRTRT